MVEQFEEEIKYFNKFFYNIQHQHKEFKRCVKNLIKKMQLPYAIFLKILLVNFIPKYSQCISVVQETKFRCTQGFCTLQKINQNRSAHSRLQ